MNKIVKYLLLLIAGVVLISCYKDKSTIDETKLAPVIIDTTAMSKEIRIGYLDHLKLSPVVSKNGVKNHKDLVCSWSCTEIASTSDLIKIQDGIDLDFEVNRVIDAKPYILRLEVKDTEYDYSYYLYWDIYVTSSFGEGLFVSYTDDNTTSDIALVMDKPITPLYNGPLNIRKALYESANGAPLPSPILSSCYTYRSNLSRSTMWLTLKNGTMLSMNCNDYRDDKISMIYTPENFKAIRFADAHQGVILASSEGIYVIKQNDSKPGMPMKYSKDGGDPENGILSFDNGDQMGGNTLVWYSPTKGAFFGYSSPFAPGAVAYGSDPTAVFNPAALPNKECKAAGLSVDKSIHAFLLKDKASGDYSIYTLEKSYTDWENDANSHPDRAKGKFDIPTVANTILNNAKSIFFMIDFSVMYAVTETGVYAFNFVSSPVNYSVNSLFTVPAGEKISLAKLYQDGLYTTNRDWFDDSGTTVASSLNNRALIIATQKGEFEGTIYVVPMIRNLASTGVLETDVTKMHKYTGFSKILDVITQGVYLKSY